jgi:hypothetical protein
MFARMLAAGHSDMNIEVFGTEDPRVTHTEQPKLISDRGGMRQAILSALKGEKRQLHELRVVIVNAGYSVKSLNGCIHLMQQEKLIRRAGYGVFAITAKGRNHEAA